MYRLTTYLLARTPDGDQPGDARLLEAFVRFRDEAAFTLLVRRHGPMVFAVCRRWLTHPADVDDAVQATFLVLVRKADSIARPDRLACWLHGVALRTARALRNRDRQYRR